MADVAAIIRRIQAASLIRSYFGSKQKMELSLLVMTVSVATLCVAIVMLATTNINRSRFDAMIGNESSESLEQVPM
jgi:hypothetical protein